MRRLDHIHFESRPVLRVAFRRNHQYQTTLKLDLQMSHIRPNRHIANGLAPEARHRPDDPAEILQVQGAHASRSASNCERAAFEMRSAWMNRDDFEVASIG